MDSLCLLKPEDLPKVPFLEGISARYIRARKFIPLEFKDNILKIVMADPGDRGVVDALSAAFDAVVVVYRGDVSVIDDYISRYYSQESHDMNKVINDIDERGAEFANEEEEDVGHLKDMASEAPVIHLVNLLITRAVEGRASDIHIEPYESDIRFRYRIDGVLHDMETAPKRLQAAIISRVKIMARLNIAERRLPQDGRIRMKIDEKEIDLRVSTIPVLHGESVVMRILDREGVVVDLDRLGFPPPVLDSFSMLINRPNGILLVTGPTGSGKTTTLYGALDRINSPDKKIITVEDPVEYQIRGINQIQVKPRIGLNFATTLRHIVRQDPDIIMIGEVRDLETADIAIQSALTGHLVFSTLHTNDAPSAVTRLLDLGVEPFLLSSTIRGILAQRLVRVICPACREPDPAADPGQLEALGVPGAGSGAVLYRGRGCEKCTYTGFYGRTGLFELLVVSEKVRRLIMKETDSNHLREAAREEGMRTLIEDGAAKVAAGITTFGEVFRVTQEA
ncbi:MAG: type II secretion system ATPase GspE [Syntrophaceae bacterium]